VTVFVVLRHYAYSNSPAQDGIEVPLDEMDLASAVDALGRCVE